MCVVHGNGNQSVVAGDAAISGNIINVAGVKTGPEYFGWCTDCGPKCQLIYRCIAEFHTVIS